MKQTACFVAFWLTLATPVFAQWTPPAGIPAPPIGIEATATTPTRLTSPFTTNCSAAAPCLVRGGTYGWVDITGSYLIIEKAKLYGCSIAAGAHHIVIRDSEIVGDLTGGGCTIGNGDAGAAHYVVLLRNKIHDMGNVMASTDADVHALGVGYESDHVWILDNTIWRCGGDGVQVNGGQGRPNWRNLHHIYIGRNTATHCRQNGIWVKNSADVVVSENVVTNMRANSGGPGNGLGSQYGSDRLVYIGNRASNVPYGIGISSDSDGFGRGVLVYGNVVFDTVHDPNNGLETLQNAWSDNTGILALGGVTRILLHNTLVRVGAGIGIPASGGTVAGANNLIARVSRAHVALEGSTILNLRRTLFGERPILYQAVTADDLVGTPVFTGADDFTLLAGPGKGQAAPINPNDAYKAISGGVDYRTVHGVDLPAPSSDIGAFGVALLPHPLTEPGVNQPPPVITPPPVVPPVPPALPKCSTVPNLLLRLLAWARGLCVG